MTEKKQVVAKCECGKGCGLSFVIPDDVIQSFGYPEHAGYYLSDECPNDCPDPEMEPIGFEDFTLWVYYDDSGGARSSDEDWG